MNYESQFIESQWKHAVSRMKMPAVRDSASPVRIPSVLLKTRAVEFFRNLANQVSRNH